ncbi:hypothetical protein OG901_40215 [Streptomyces mirabilis]|uniref:hypothetical protein n=1 Tax=Streptomyces mirabilis TaxID=68239 RepID=UPI00224FAFBE|nr:hypothetical protein [Streptomyces mirabilis]MCX5353895.1 hypothetical protein [Streptomyces mirabilis]
MTAVTELNPGASAFVNTSSGFVATLSDNHWPPAAPEGPYGGTPAAVPGTVQAENPLPPWIPTPLPPHGAIEVLSLTVTLVIGL